MKKVLFSLVALLLLVMSGVAQNTTFTKVTSASDLEAGVMYIIVGYDDNLGYCAMSYQKQNNRHAVSVTEDGGSITVTPAIDPYSESDVHQFMLGGSNNAWTFYDPLREGYLYAASSSSNQLKTQSTNNANGEWTIEFNEDGTAVVTAQGENTRNIMRFNENSSNGTPLFSCYNSGSSINVPVSLYKAGGAAQPDPEPTNYPTNFIVSEVNGVDVTLTWTDATGGQLPSKYLVLATYGEVTLPTDGQAVADSQRAKNVAYGTQTVTFTGLGGGVFYRFAIFPYTNSGATIDYKTDGTYPTADATTEDIYVLLNEDFDEDLGEFTTYDAYGDQSWHQGTYQGTTYANMNGYAAGSAHQNEDWLIGFVDPMGVTYNEIWLEFSTAMKFDGDPLRVAISCDYELNAEPGDYEWVDITDAFDYSTGNYEWVESGKVNIVDMIPCYPSSFYIAFIYTSSDEAASSWEIDYVKVTGQDINAVNENETVSINLYPNPASDQVTFTIENDAQVSVFDVTGRMVIVTDCQAGQAQLNVSELVDGVYFANFRFANGSKAVAKFVKL